MLKETALRTGFPDLLTSVASRERLPRDVLHRRLIAVSLWSGDQYRVQAPAQCRSWHHGLGSALCAQPLYPQGAIAQCHRPCRQRHLPRLRRAYILGRRGRPPAPPIPKNSGPGTRICSPNGILAIADPESWLIGMWKRKLPVFIRK